MVQIRNVKRIDEVESLIVDEAVNENIRYALEKTENHIVFGIYDDLKIVGVFAFLIIEDEKYLELTVCVSEDQRAYEIMFHELKHRYIGYRIDFAFYTRNTLLKEQILASNAQLETESQKMILTNPIQTGDSDGVSLLIEEYEGQFKSIYYNEGYWTGEKILESREKFTIFTLVIEKRLIGYAVFTNFLDVNELWGIYILDQYRRRGYARKLMHALMKYNGSKPMALDVLVDNIPAIGLYESLGFVKVEGENILVAHWDI